MWITKSWDEPDKVPPVVHKCVTCIFFDRYRRGTKRSKCVRIGHNVRRNFSCEGWIWDEGGERKWREQYEEDTII